MTKHHLLDTPLLALVLATGANLCANADLILYEPFDYGSSDAGLVSCTGTALGLDGTNYTGWTSSTYEAAGFSFSDLVVSGGKALIPYYAAAQANTRGLDCSIAPGGSLFGSFIYTPVGAALNSTGALLFGASNSTDNNANLAVIGTWYNTTAKYTGLNSTPVSIQSTGAELALNLPVLMLFHVTNMGASSGSQTLTLWVFSEAQYEAHKPNGLTPAYLNGLATGSAANQILQTATLTKSVTPYVTMTDTMSMRLFIYRCGYRIDEIRLSTSSLDEVTPGPDKATVIMIR